VDGKKLGGIGLSIILIGVAVWLRVNRRSDDSEIVKSDMMQVVAMMKGYDQHKTLIDTMAGTAHNVAFHEAYTMARRRKAAEFSDDKYLEAFWRSMLHQVDIMGRADLKKSILELKAAGESGEAPTLVSNPPDPRGDPAGEDSTHGEDENSVEPDGESDSPAGDENEGELNEGREEKLSLADIPDGRLEETLHDRIREKIAALGTNELKAAKALTKGERMLYVTWQAENEISNGGFEQYFDNSSGVFAREAILAFKLVGAKKHVLLMRRAIAAFVRSNPKQKLVKVDKSVKGYLKKYKDAEFGKIDEAFHNIKENLSELRIKYIRAHPDEFGQD
jgi:hypothetical protein